MTTVEIYAHAEVLRVRARLIPVSGTGHLETLILRAIGQGVSDVDDLADMFGISTRLALDVVGDLWRAGRVAVNVDDVREALSITTSALDELGQLSEGGSLPSSHSVADSEYILLDKLSGRVLPRAGSRNRPPDATLVVDLAPGDPTRANLEQEAIDDAVAAGLRDRRRGTEDRMDSYRVVGTTVPPAQSEPTYRYIPYLVEVARDASGELLISVVDDRLPLTHRDIATKRLSALVHAVPRPPFVRRLEGLVAGSLYKPRGLNELRADFERAVSALADCAPANRQAKHDQLAAAARQIFYRIESDAQHQMTVKLLRSDGAHVAALRSLIRDARQQLVITVPWITEKGIRPYLSDLQDALGRGVHVTILWGIKSKGEDLPGPVKNHFLALQRSEHAGGQLHVPSVPSHLHAKVAVMDDRAVLVTSRNFFSDSHHDEVGVRLDALPDLRCPAIEEILQWAHSMAPTQTVADQIATDGRTLGTDVPPWQLPPLPLPRFRGDLPGAAINTPQVALWLAGWEAARDKLLDLLLLPDVPTVSLVTDGYHRALAVEAFRKASRRIIVTSDQVSADVLTSGMVMDARAAASRGVAVTMVHCAGRDAGAQMRIAELKAPAEEPSTSPPVVRALRGWHGKVLVFDDSSVIGSYNFLSRDSTKSRGRSTGEVSVRIDDPVTADLLAAGLRHKDQVEPARESQRKAADPSAAEATVAAQDFLEAAIAPNPIIERARRLLTEQPKGVLEALRIHAPAAYESALAALVAKDPDGRDRDAWAGELVERLWARGAWWLAATIARAFPKIRVTCESGTMFDAMLAILPGASVDRGLLPDIPLTTGQRDAVALYAAHQLLTTGEMGLYAALSAWEPQCSPDITGLVSLVTTATRRLGFVGDQIGRQARSDAATARSEKAWRNLDHAVSELRRYKPNTPPGNQLLAHLFGEGGEMRKLEELVRARDILGLKSWSNGSEEESSRWLERARKRAGLQQQIQNSQKTSFIKKHDALWHAADGALGAGRTSPDAAATGELLTFETEASDLLTNVAPRAGISGQLLNRVRAALSSAIQGQSQPPVPGATREDWRFPTLLRVEWTKNDPDSDAVARAVAADAFARWTAPDSVTNIVEAGEYKLAEEVLGQDSTRQVLSTFEAEQLEDRIREARQRFGGSVSELIGLLRARADCAGVALPAGEPHPVPNEVERRADVERDLDAWQVQVELRIHEATLAAQRDLEPRMAAMSGPEATLIRALIDEGDFVAARGFADDPEQLSVGVLEPRSRLWPHRHISLSQVLFHLRDEEHGAATLREFTPQPGDWAGAALVDSLEGLESGPERAAAVTTYANAFESLISTMRHPKRVLQRVGDDPETASYVTQIAVAHPESLPPFVWPGGTITVALGDQDQDEALVRLSLRMAARTDEPQVVDIAKALSLLAPVSGEHGLVEARATRFLRLICPQLRLKDVVDVASLGNLDDWRDRARLWALMDVLGLQVPDKEKASLLAVAGHHPHLMWHLIDEAMNERRESPDVIKASTLDTSQLLARPNFDDIVLRAVRDDITDPFELATLLAVALWRDEAGIPLPYVRAALQDAHVPAPKESELDEALSSLTKRSYLLIPSPGHFRLPNTPLGRAIERHDPEGLLSAIAQELMHEATSTSTDWAHGMAQLFRIAYDGSTLTAVDIQNPDIPCDLSRWAWLMASKNWTPTADPESPPITVVPKLDLDLWVAGPSGAVVGAIENLMGNAVSVLLATREGDGELALVVQDNGDGTVLVEVADNGPGLPDDVIAYLHSGILEAEDGRGNGLARIQQDARALGWTVTAGRHPILGGASVSICMPRLAGGGRSRSGSGN